MNKTIRTLLLALLMVTATGAALSAQTRIGFERYYERTDFLMAAPGAMTYGLYGYDNPALLQYLHQPDMAFYWTSDKFAGDIGRWGLISGSPGFSFSFFNNDFDDVRFRDYRIAFGGGTDAAAAGFAINWYRGNTAPQDLRANFTMGTLFRPAEFISVGLTGTATFNYEYYEAVADLAVRPLGTPLLTLFGDYAVGEGANDFFDGRWSAGAAIEAIPGVRFTGRYIDDMGFTAGVQFSLGRAGASYQAHRDTDGNHRYNTYSIRAGAMDRNIFDSFFRKDKHYVNVGIQGGLPYQTYQFMDQRQTYLTTLDQIHKAAADPSVSGIVVNTTRMQIDQAKTWEIRSALKEAQASGKKVIVYVERGGMNIFHLASVADYVIMDPYGGLVIPGYVTGSTYLADMLSAIGIGVDEFREMEFKSAFEALSRTGMSDADREQRQAIIDGFYDLVKADVIDGRGITEDAFDSLINRGIALSPSDLVDAGIVDTLARYTDVSDIIEKLEGGKKDRVGPGELYVYNKPRDDQWGPTKKIAVFYAEGPTMNETGIRARALSSAIREARNDNSVKAVVMRADSPGGDPLASDLVAEELHKTSEVKPVIVSMGRVAASGGYWISMYADTIVVAPNTVTGSIGVISGWIWDDGMSRHLRLHTDQVKRGESADLSFGPTLPLIGLSLPNRPLTAQEREGLTGRVNMLYDQFIEHVADGRDAEFDAIKEVAAGRVWTGADAIDRQLADEIGSLYTAIKIAKEKAGIRPGDKVEIVEGPEPQPFSLPFLLGRVFASDPPEIKHKDPVREYLELMIDNNANPLVIMPFEYFQWMYYLEMNEK